MTPGGWYLIALAVACLCLFALTASRLWGRSNALLRGLLMGGFTVSELFGAFMASLQHGSNLGAALLSLLLLAIVPTVLVLLFALGFRRTRG